MAGNSLAQVAAILITTRVADKKAANDAGVVPLPDSARAASLIQRALPAGLTQALHVQWPCRHGAAFRFCRLRFLTSPYQRLSWV